MVAALTEINHFLRRSGHIDQAAGVQVWGGRMADMAVLRHEEGVRLDPDRLMALYEDLGEAGAENVVSRAMEELSHRMAEMQRQYQRLEIEAFCRNARSLGRVAVQVGMTSLARVAQDVADCAATGDAVALAATWARLSRLSDQSLVAVCDLQDMSV